MKCAKQMKIYQLGMGAVNLFLFMFNFGKNSCSPCTYKTKNISSPFYSVFT